MALYNVEVIENLSRVVEQEADSYEDAEELVINRYKDEEIVLDWEDLNYTKYEPYPSQELKDSFILQLDFSKEDGSVIIGTDTSSGAEYRCRTIEDLKDVFNSYVDNYIELEQVKSEEKVLAGDDYVQ